MIVGTNGFPVAGSIHGVMVLVGVPVEGTAVLVPVTVAVGGTGVFVRVLVGVFVRVGVFVFVGVKSDEASGPFVGVFVGTPNFGV